MPTEIFGYPTLISHYGFLANRWREQKLARIRRALETVQTPERNERHGEREKGIPCPICKAGRLLLVAELPARMPWESIAQRR